MNKSAIERLKQKLSVEDIERLEHEIVEWMNKHCPNNDCDIIRSIVFYQWDDNPRWFIMLVNEASAMLIDMKKRNAEAKKLGLRIIRPQKRKDAPNLNSLSRYIEVDVYPSFHNKYPQIERIEIANHGHPCISEEVYFDDARYEPFDPKKELTEPIENSNE